MHCEIQRNASLTKNLILALNVKITFSLIQKYLQFFLKMSKSIIIIINLRD